jgi:hypothetical protein
MTRTEVCELLRCKPSKLARGWGPKPLRCSGRQVLYHPDDVARWQSECRQISSDAEMAVRGGSGSSSEGTSTDAALAQQIDERLSAKLERSEQRLKRPRLVRTNDGAA